MNRIIVICVLAGLIGCDKKKTQETTNGAGLGDVVAQQESKNSPSDSFEIIKTEYEACRKLLATDMTKGIKEHATKIAQASATGAHKNELAKLTEAANELANLKGEDIAEARLLFGTLSEQWISYLKTQPALAEDFHVFECPMAKGYKKWVQPTDGLENPYMGSSMLHCGSKSDF